MQKTMQLVVALLLTTIPIPSANALRSVGTEVTFIAHHSSKNVGAKENEWNKLDSAVVACNSASGCVLGIASIVGTKRADEQLEISSWVDGKRADPAPILTSAAGFGRQNAFLTQGRHVIRTKVYLVNGLNFGPWEVEYTVYEGVKPRGQ